MPGHERCEGLSCSLKPSFTLSSGNPEQGLILPNDLQTKKGGSYTKVPTLENFFLFNSGCPCCPYNTQIFIFWSHCLSQHLAAMMTPSYKQLLFTRFVYTASLFPSWCPDISHWPLRLLDPAAQTQLCNAGKHTLRRHLKKKHSSIHWIYSWTS